MGEKLREEYMNVRVGVLKLRCGKALKCEATRRNRPRYVREEFRERIYRSRGRLLMARR